LRSFVDQLLAIKRSLRVSSRQLAQQLAHLLLRFGILARVQHTAGDWTVTPMGTGRREEGKEQIIYDEITHIEARGLRPVFDLTIDDTHNFVASDVCVHNTAFALACARNAAMSSDRPVSCAIFSMEMSARQLAQRLLTSEARVNAQAARAGKLRQSEFDAVVRAANAFAHTRIFIDDTAGLGVLELRAKCRRLKSEHDIGLVLVDYLQLMQGRSKDNREQEIANISRSLKGLAKELDIPVIALSDAGHITCTANDFGFAEIFARPLLALGHPGDLLIVLSTSGNSENVVRAAVAAKSRGMKVFGLLGRDGGSLKQHCDSYLIAPGDTADRIQEIHIKVLHILIEQIERLMFPKNY